MKIKEGVSQTAVEQMVLCRLLFQEGASLCRALDKIQFARGILGIHDAVELALNVACQQEDVGLKADTSFREYLQRFNAKKTDDPLPYEKEMASLNNARVSIKHYGKFPNGVDLQREIKCAEELLNRISMRCFEVRLQDFTLGFLITNQEVRSKIDFASESLREGEIAKCVGNLLDAYRALVKDEFIGPMAHLLDANFVPAATAPPLPRVQWETFGIQQQAWFIDHGIDVPGFYRFRAILPLLGRDSKTGEYQTADSPLSHSGNWTPQILASSIDFLIDMAIKLENPGYSRGLVADFDYFSYKATITAPKTQVLSQNAACADFGPTWQNISGVETLKVLTKGQVLAGKFRKERDDPKFWYVESDELVTSKNPLGAGVIAASDVDVKRTPKEAESWVRAGNPDGLRS